MLWIIVKLDGHYLFFNSNLSSHIALGTNKETWMHYIVVRTSWLRREMPFTNNNVMSFETWTPLTSSIINNSWWQNLFSSNLWRFEKNPLIVDIQNQLRNQHQIQNLSCNHAKFKFRNGLLYLDGIFMFSMALFDFKFSKLCMMF